MNNQKNLTKMLEYEPYSCVMKNYEFADILFENEGLMTVPRNSANTLTELLNTAYKNGVKSTIKQYSLIGSQGSMNPPQNVLNKQNEPIIIDNPINTFSKTKKKFKIF
jgi:hypothetical protein